MIINSNFSRVVLKIVSSGGSRGAQTTAKKSNYLLINTNSDLSFAQSLKLKSMNILTL